MNNLSKTAKTLDNFFHILQVLLSILCVAAVVGLAIIGAGFLFNLDPTTIGTNYELIDLAFIELEVAAAYAPTSQVMLLHAAVNLALGFVTALIGRIGVKYIRQILQPMTQNQPFNSIVSNNLKKSATLSIILGVCYNLVTLVDQLMAVFVLDVPSLLISEKITHVTVNYSFDLTFLAVSGMLFLLSYIFRYGEELQQLSDETL